MLASQPYTRTPALFVGLDRGCPRCDGILVRDLPVVAVGSTFDWHECQECGYLWAIPQALADTTHAGGLS